MLARFGATYDQFSAKEFFVVQFLHGALRFFDRQHLDEGKTLRTLVMSVGDNFSVLHCADTVEEFEEIALCRIERQIPDIKPGRGNFYRLRFAGRARRFEPIVARCLRHRPRRPSGWPTRKE